MDSGEISVGVKAWGAGSRILAEEQRSDRVLCTYLDMRLCGDWLPAADGGNRMWQPRVVTRRITRARTMDGEKKSREKGNPLGNVFSYISSLSAPRI